MNDLHIQYAIDGYAIVTSGDTSDTLPFDQAEDKYIKLFKQWTIKFCSHSKEKAASDGNR